MRLSGLIAAPDGSSVIRAQATGVAGDGEALGRRLAHLLLRDGGAALLGAAVHEAAIRGRQPPPSGDAMCRLRITG